MGRWTGNAQWIFAGILPLFLGLAVLELLHYRTDREHLKQVQADQFRVEYATILECLQAQARFVFNESIDKPEVLTELHAAWRADDEAERSVHRDRLHALLAPTWSNLQAAGFRQFHFHFPDCTSFLRLHRPERFGDSLEEFRATVAAVNRDQVPVVGFEEGRIFNAYRNVFPLFHAGEHVGSVEVSFSLMGIRTTLQDLIGGRHQMIMSREVVQQKLFTEERTNYAAWPWHDGYLLDTAASHASLFPHPGVPADRKDMRRRIEAGLQSGEDFGFHLRLANHSHILHFTPIRNFTGGQVAYWVYLSESPALDDLRMYVITTTSVFLLVILLALGVLLWIRRMQRKLKEAESFLPVCATCKKVRQVDSDFLDPRSWISIEEYFTRQTDAKISHGMCPDCYQKTMEENDL